MEDHEIRRKADRILFALQTLKEFNELQPEERGQIVREIANRTDGLKDIQQGFEQAFEQVRRGGLQAMALVQGVVDGFDQFARRPRRRKAGSR